MKLLLNGQLIDSNDAVISVFDHGFLYGMGLFETFRSYDGRPWLLERHAERLRQGCETLGINYAPDPGEMRSAIALLLQENGLGDGYIRWSVSAGADAIGLPAHPYDRPNEIVYVKALAPDRPDTRQGKALYRLQTPRSTPETPVRLKSFHYMNNILAKRELVASGAAAGAEGLFLNANGYIVEGMVSNVFWMSNGVLRTPAVESGLLPGITRQFVIELAERLALPLEQGLYGWDELFAADEVFVTNSVQEIVPATALLDGMGRERRMEGLTGRSDNDAAGSMTSRLMKMYRQLAERNTDR